MAHKYTITTPAESVRVDGGRGEAAFTVTNVSGVPDRAMGKLVAQGSTKAEWLSVVGENEREFPVNGVNQYNVAVNIPATTPPGSYPFRFDIVSALARTGEDYDEGPTVKLQVEKADETHGRWWIWVAAAVVLVAAGVIAWLVLRNKDDGKVAVPQVTQRPFIEAIKAVQSAHLKVALAGQKDDAAAPGTVLGQKPPSGEKVDQQSEVSLTVATRGDADLKLSEAESAALTDDAAARLTAAVAGPPPVAQVTVPSLSADPVRAAIQLQGLQLLPLFVPVNIPNFPVGRVVDQQPRAGTTVATNSEVRLFVSQQRTRPWLLEPVRGFSATTLSRAEKFNDQSKKRLFSTAPVTVTGTH